MTIYHNQTQRVLDFVWWVTQTFFMGSVVFNAQIEIDEICMVDTNHECKDSLKLTGK